MRSTIVDLTKAFHGSEEGIIRGVISSTGSSSSELVVLALGRQRPALDATFPSAEVVDIAASSPEFGVLQWMQDHREALSVGDGPVRVFSFNQSVLQLQHVWNEPRAPQRFVFHHLGAFRQRAEPSDTWPRGWVDLDDALSLLVAALTSAGTSPVRKTHIRPLLAARDARFSKDASPTAARPGIISTLLREAAVRGLIEEKGEEPHVHVSLTPKGHDVIEPPSAEAAQDRNTAPNGEPRAESPSEAYIRILRGVGFGFPGVRHQLYEHFEIAVKENAGQSLGKLISQAMDSTIAEGAPPTKSGRPYAWSGLRRCFVKLMLAEPVALDERDELVRPAWGGLATPVVGLVDDWREALDGVLIRALVENGALIESDQLEELAGALLLRRDDDAQAFVNRCVDRLLYSQVLAEDPVTSALRLCTDAGKAPNER